MDIQLLNRWFKKGYTSREMAMFLLLEYFAEYGPHVTAEQFADKFESLHDEVVKIIYQK